MQYDDYKSCFEYIKTEMHLEHDSNMTTITLNDVEYPCLFTSFFVIFYNGEYNLSFTINKYKIQQIAKLTQLLTLFFGELLEIIEDHFVEIKTGYFYLGDDAYAKYEEKMYDKIDSVKCPVCENVVRKHLMLDKGYCKICEDVTLKNLVWN